LSHKAEFRWTADFEHVRITCKAPPTRQVDQVEVPLKKLLPAIASLIIQLLLACVASARGVPEVPAGRVEIGTLAGAPYRIDIPAQWNRVMIIYYHGYAKKPVTFAADKPTWASSIFATAGFAVAQSGYSATGWAVQQGLTETEKLRAYTVARYGKARETYVMGWSIGGLMTIASIENFPDRYDGALPLCGVIQGTARAMQRQGALLAAFHYYYPGLLPGPRDIAGDVPLDDEFATTVLPSLTRNPVGLAEMLALAGMKSSADLASGMVFDSHIQRDLAQRSGGSILDNHNWIYAGGADDYALNGGVVRYTASPNALAYLNKWYTPSGLLRKPVLAVHTVYDPVVPSEVVALYASEVQRTASDANFVQQYVKGEGHCNISDNEVMSAMLELIQWKRTGVKPPGGALRISTP
jgi:pimeloyl-ACP methyl ester carboxylesterase